MDENKFPIIDNVRILAIADDITKILAGIDGRDMSLDKYRINDNDKQKYLELKHSRGRPTDNSMPNTDILKIIQCINLYFAYLNDQ